MRVYLIPEDFGSLKAIHYRHITIHEYNLISSTVLIIAFSLSLVISDSTYSQLTVLYVSRLLLDTHDFEEGFKGVDVELIVVYDEDLGAVA